MRSATPRVAVLLPSLDEGAVERVALHLAEGLLAQRMAVDVVVLSAEGRFRDLVPKRARVVDLGATRAIAGFGALVRYLRRERPAALVSHKDYLNVVALHAALFARVPTRVGVVTHVALARHLARTEHRRERLVPLLARLSYPRAHAVVAVSEGAADDLSRLARLDRARIRVIHNPVAPPLPRPDAVPHPWMAPGAPPVVLAVGRLVPQKDFATLLRAFARLRAEREARLLLVGEGPERPRLEALVRDLGLAKDVELAGFVDDVAVLMADASLLALSSAWEGLPTVLVEALACGTPVVATDCPSGPREILEGGRWGALVPVGDDAALAAAISRTIDAPPPRDALRKRAADFGVERAARLYLEALGLAPQGGAPSS